MNRLPQSWAGWVVWSILGIAAFWSAYRFGVFYGACREGGSDKVWCLSVALYATFIQVLVQAFQTFVKLATLVLP
jgi:hypothetical protein